VSKVKCKNVTLGDNADTTKNLSINVPATADGTLILGKESGADILTVNNAGDVNIVNNLTIGNVTVKRIFIGTAVATTSGTSIDVTGIPSWAKRVTVSFSGVSTNGTSSPVVRLGTLAGGIESSGYVGTNATYNGSTLTTALFVSGFAVVNGPAAANAHYGGLVLDLVDVSANTWIANGGITVSGSNLGYNTSGAKSLSGVLDRIRLTTSGGTDTFDAGTMSVSDEG
jgi:hypothetical protein